MSTENIEQQSSVETESAKSGSLHPAGSASFLRAAMADVTVAMMLRQKQPLEVIIGQLAAEKEQYVKRIMELESIAPRKIVMPDGEVMLWQCPAELVPPVMPNDLHERPGATTETKPAKL